jgi:hypothetical protein
VHGLIVVFVFLVCWLCVDVCLGRCRVSLFLCFVSLFRLLLCLLTRLIFHVDGERFYFPLPFISQGFCYCEFVFLSCFFCAAVAALGSVRRQLHCQEQKPNNSYHVRSTSQRGSGADASIHGPRADATELLPGLAIAGQQATNLRQRLRRCEQKYLNETNKEECCKHCNPFRCQLCAFDPHVAELQEQRRCCLQQAWAKGLGSAVSSGTLDAIISSLPDAGIFPRDHGSSSGPDA